MLLGGALLRGGGVRRGRAFFGRVSSQKIQLKIAVACRRPVLAVLLRAMRQLFRSGTSAKLLRVLHLWGLAITLFCDFCARTS